jgi:hypothetical protein
LTDEEDSFLELPDYYEKWHQNWPEGVSFSKETKTFFLQLTREYSTSLDQYAPPLMPKTKIAFDPHGFDTYTHGSLVPEFIRSEGNYASALCCFFDMRDTILHDGNCGIESFFVALNGPQEYEEPDSVAKIQECVGPFRKAIVEYATLHKADFPIEYRVDLEGIINCYNDSTQTDWTGTAEWFCAAQVYEREIRLFSRSEGDFRIDAKGEIEPAAILVPLNGAAKGPPVNIMMYGKVHYCPLIPKAIT